MELRFSDGMSFNTDGPLRAIKERDGWYVCGQGMLYPVGSYAEAVAVIQATAKQEDMHANEDE